MMNESTFRIGDEVEEINGIRRFWVTKIGERISGWCYDGEHFCDGFELKNKKYWRKTGRHIDSFERILKTMRGDDHEIKDVKSGKWLEEMKEANDG